jgi:hypothetical protein
LYPFTPTLAAGILIWFSLGFSEEDCFLNKQQDARHKYLDELESDMLY